MANKIQACIDKELIKTSAQYFKDNEDKNEIFVSTDGQFFWTINQSSFHCKTIKTAPSRITRSMAEKSSKK